MEITIKRDGLKLYGLLEGTTTIKNDTIAILMHGFKGNLGYDDSKILYALSHYLNQQGIPTLRFDFDGTGHSDGEFKDMTVFSEILDGMKIIDYAHTTMQAKLPYWSFARWVSCFDAGGLLSRYYYKAGTVGTCRNLER